VLRVRAPASSARPDKAGRINVLGFVAVSSAFNAIVLALPISSLLRVHARITSIPYEDTEPLPQRPSYKFVSNRPHPLVLPNLSAFSQSRIQAHSRHLDSTLGPDLRHLQGPRA